MESYLHDEHLGLIRHVTYYVHCNMLSESTEYFRLYQSFILLVHIAPAPVGGNNIKKQERTND